MDLFLFLEKEVIYAGAAAVSTVDFRQEIVILCERCRSCIENICQEHMERRAAI